jgi:hypothetical protein
MNYNIHGWNLGLGCMEKYVKNAQVSVPEEMLKGWKGSVN